MSTMTHATVNGVRYGIDADGNVLAPDADGRADQLVIGCVTRVGRNWEGRTSGPDHFTQRRATRRSAIEYLVGHATLSQPTRRSVNGRYVVTLDNGQINLIVSALGQCAAEARRNPCPYDATADEWTDARDRLQAQLGDGPAPEAARRRLAARAATAEGR